MSIVVVTAKAGTSKVKYGQSEFQVAQDGTIDVPGYVAHTLLTLDGFTSAPALTDTAAALLAATDPGAAFEANYIFWAYGQPIPAENQITAAGALLTARGEPTVSAS